MKTWSASRSFYSEYRFNQESESSRQDVGRSIEAIEDSKKEAEESTRLHAQTGNRQGLSRKG
jgi:hypothetical protein